VTKHLAALLLVGCGLPPTDPSVDASGECPLDPCAWTGVDTAAGIACCIDAHGRGLTGDAAEALAAGCQGAACDPSLYLSEEAAVCAAQVCGLSSGLGTCGGEFQLTEGGGSWTVYNVEEDCPPGANLCGGGDVVQIDARSGECQGTGSWSS
jgi:hypothetical protein